MHGFASGALLLSLNEFLSLLSLTIHLSFIRQDNLPPSTGRVDGQGLLEALLDVRAPDPLGVPVHVLISSRVAQPVHVLACTLAATPATALHAGR